MVMASLLPLHNDRATLRPMRHQDVGAYVAGTKDLAVREYGHLPVPEYTEATVRDLIDGPIQDGLETGELAVLTLADPATDDFAGSLVLFEPTSTSIEVGFWVHPDHRGHGLAAAGLDLAHELARLSGFTGMPARRAHHRSRG